MEKIIEDRKKLISSLDIINVDFQHPGLEEIIKKIQNDDKKDYVSLSQEDFDKVSYARSEDHIYDNKKRVKTTFERYVRRQLELGDSSISDYTLNHIGRKLRIKLTPQENLDKDIRILSGEEIKDFYKTSDIESCMTGSSSYKTALYALNPKHIALVTYKDESRALLWTTNEGVKILDRIYPNECETSSLLKTWAERKGFITRCDNCQSSDDHILLSDKEEYSFDLIHNNIFPYMDTFCYGYIKGNKVTLSNKESDDCITFQSTDGYHNGGENCHNCDHHVDQDDVVEVHGDSYCSECYNDLFFTCDNCDDVYEDEERRIGSDDHSYCEGCFDRLFYTCEYCNEPVRKRDATCIDGDHYCQDCVEENFTMCEHCDDYVKTDEIVTHDNECYCQGCFDDKFAKCSECCNYFEKSDRKCVKGESYCEDCFEEKFSQCFTCNKDFEKSELKSVNNENYCIDCMPKD